MVYPYIYIYIYNHIYTLLTNYNDSSRYILLTWENVQDLIIWKKQEEKQLFTSFGINNPKVDSRTAT